jgi:hypothetical protein
MFELTGFVIIDTRDGEYSFAYTANYITDLISNDDGPMPELEELKFDLDGKDYTEIIEVMYRDDYEKILRHCNEKAWQRITEAA